MKSNAAAHGMVLKPREGVSSEPVQNTVMRHVNGIWLNLLCFVVFFFFFFPSTAICTIFVIILPFFSYLWTLLQQVWSCINGLRDDESEPSCLRS